MALYSCLVLSTLFYHANGFGSGAPFSTCFTQYPKHDGTGTQTSPSPFQFKLTPSSYRPGQEIQIEVTDKTGEKFRGIQIAARRSSGNQDEIVGRFVEFPTDKMKAFNCFGGYQNMLTHMNDDKVTKITFKWKAPDENAGKVTFKATIVRSYKVFWHGLTLDLPVDSTSPVISPKYPAIPLTNQTTSIDFDGCGDTKGCFYYPRHCTGSDCMVAATYLYRSSTKDFLFELFSGHDSDYISIGFSRDEWMGNDVTVSCTGRTGVMSVQEGYNPRQHNDRHLNLFSSFHEVKYQDGKLQCRFVLPESFEVYEVVQGTNSAKVTEKVWNLKDDWYLMLAWGSTMPESDVMAHHHDLPAISMSKVDLSEKVITLSSSFHILVRAHASLMMVAWILLTGLLTIIARHYREWLPRTRWFGTKVWFQIHRGMAILVFVLTVIGVILVFYNYGIKIQKHALKHAAVGLTVVGCMCLQIIAGILRPGGDHKMRPYFNWGHWFLGQVSHILAAAAMFLAYDIKVINSELRRLGFIVLAVWVVVNVIWIIIFEVISRRRNKYSQTVNLASHGNQFKIVENESEDLSPNSVILLSLYAFSLVGLSVAAMVVFLLY